MTQEEFNNLFNDYLLTRTKYSSKSIENIVYEALNDFANFVNDIISVKE